MGRLCLLIISTRGVPASCRIWLVPSEQKLCLDMHEMQSWCSRHFLMFFCIYKLWSGNKKQVPIVWLSRSILVPQIIGKIFMLSILQPSPMLLAKFGPSPIVHEGTPSHWFVFQYFKAWFWKKENCPYASWRDIITCIVHGRVPFRNFVKYLC